MLYAMKFGIFEIDFDMQDNSEELKKWQEYDDIKIYQMKNQNHKL